MGESSQKKTAAALDRRELLAYSALFGTSFLAAQGLCAAEEIAPKSTAQPKGEPNRLPMKKSINLWAFPYPQKMTLKECFALAAEAGFDAVEINYALEGDLSPQASAADIEAIGQSASSAGIAISGVCSFLYWPYSLTANDPERRKKGLELAGKMIDAASLLGTENLLVVPGAVFIPWLKEMEPVANAACYERSKAAIEKLLPQADKHKIYLNVENIFANAFLMSPQEMVQFVDSFQHDRVKIHFDTGNIMQYQFPQHWIPVLGKRIKNIHFKEYNQRSGEFNLEAFRPLLDGTTDWPAVMAALEKTGYDGYLTFEYFHPFQHWPEALVYQTSAALDRMLGRAVKTKTA
jgi:L-ribulose-5-phosphate 3-epimerase